MESFKSCQHLRIITVKGVIANGDYIFDKDKVTVRLKDGYLNDFVDEDGNILPAVESEDGSHVEHWRNGVLHCENEPAVKDVLEGIEEWWVNGRQVLPENGGNDYERK